MDAFKKKGFTTGEVARLCHVTIPTVIKWVDTGKLPGFKVPGSKNRRIARPDLIEFMKSNKIPTTEIERLRIKILAVDDDPNMLKLFPLLFPAEKYEIRLASSGFEVGLAVEFEPDLIVLDIDLPDIHGEKICEYLRSIPKTKNIKILALSEDEREMEKLLDIGFDSYLKKPFSHELFLSAVRIVLESKRKRKKNFSKEKEEKIS